MKLWKQFVLCLMLMLLSGCMQQPAETSATPTETTVMPTEMTVLPTETTAAPTETTQPLHSELYIPGVSVEDVILYFREVVLAAEFVSGGDPAVVQKWVEPIRYSIEGPCTAEDLQVLESFRLWLNDLEGFPGMEEAADPGQANLRIRFCAGSEIPFYMGDPFQGMDGAVTFWYAENEIYDADICYSTDVDQQTRNSVILEEIYNGLGPVQDTGLRLDSIIYSGFSVPQQLTAVDELILRLLYHPDMRCGMDGAACEELIRRLYY